MFFCPFFQTKGCTTQALDTKYEDRIEVGCIYIESAEGRISLCHTQPTKPKPPPPPPRPLPPKVQPPQGPAPKTYASDNSNLEITPEGIYDKDVIAGNSGAEAIIVIIVIVVILLGIGGAWKFGLFKRFSRSSYDSVSG